MQMSTRKAVRMIRRGILKITPSLDGKGHIVTIRSKHHTARRLRAIARGN